MVEDVHIEGFEKHLKYEERIAKALEELVTMLREKLAEDDDE